MGRSLLKALIANGFVDLPEPPPAPAPRRRMLLERLEERLLFDAGPVAPTDVDPEMAQAQAVTAQQSMQEAASISEPADVRVIEPLDNVAEVVADLTKAAVNQNQALIPDANSAGSATVDGAVLTVLNANPNNTLSSGALLNSNELAQQLLTTSDEQRSELQAATSDVRHELVFIDAGVMDAATLIAGVDPRAEVIQLDANRDGVDQILEVLAQRNDVSAIHLVSHGQSGELHLGSAVLNLDTMTTDYSDRLQQIGQHLTAGADILVYGCDFAKGLVGLAAEEMLANLTGADVAGSVDATGNAALGGNWTLERDVGLVQTNTIFSLASEESWQYLLAKLDWDTVNWTSGALSQSYTVGGSTVSITLTGSTNRFVSGPVDNTTNTGGLIPVEQSLLLDVDYTAQATIATEAITATISFAHTGGISNVSFTLFDIDSSGFTDQVIVTGNNGATINPSSVTLTAGTEVVFDGVNKVTGTANNSSTSSNGNATFTFNQTGITQITIVYQSGQLANPSEQFVSLHDINFNVTPTTSNNTVTTPEDTPFTFAASDFPFSDVDTGDTLQSVKITSLPGAGSLTLSGVAVTVNQVIPVASLGSLSFAPALNGNGALYTSFGFQVSDGTAFSSTATQTVNVTPVNDAPTSANNTVTTPEDTPFTFASTDFPFTDVDAGNTLQSVKITSLPAAGSLTLSGVAVTVNQVIPVASLGNLSFAPALNGNGSPYTTFGFQVSDGITFSSTATQTVNVTPVNDAPTTANNSVTVSENSSVAFGSSDFPFSDVDIGNSLQSVKITALPAVGSLTLGGVPVAANDVIAAANLSNLVFTPVLNQSGSPYTAFGFQVSDGTAFSNTATMTVNVVAIPDLSVTVDDGGITATANDTVVYSLNYANNGMQNATGVTLTDALPTGSAFNAAASSPGWVNIGGNVYQLNIGSLPMTTSGTALFAVTVNSAIAAGQTQLVNSVSIADDGTHGADSNPANNSGSDMTPLNVAPNLRLTKSDSTSTVTPGSSVVYSLGYSNNGSQDATGVTLTESLPTGSTFDSANSTVGWSFVSGSTYQFNVGNVAVGSSGTALFAVTINNPAAAGQNNFVNSATITDDGLNGPDLDPTDNSPTDTDTLNAQPDYQLTLGDAGVTSVVAGQSVTYTVSITNIGNQDGTGVIVSGLFPNAILHNVVATGGGVVDQTSGTISWNVGNFAVGALQTFTITADVWPTIPPGYDNYAVSASVTDDLSNGSDPTPANNFGSDTNTLNAAPDLRVSKTDYATTATPGQCLVYSVSVSNVGTQGATNVLVTETVPVGTTFNNGLSDPLWVLVAPNTYQIAIANLAAGAGFNIDFDVNVTAPANPGQTDIVNTVTIADDGTNGLDPNPGNNTGTDTNTLVAVPDYQITISDGDTVVVPGQSLRYSINFTNTGDQTGTGVIVTDTFPTSVLENVVASDGGAVDTVAGTITWNIGNLAVGDARTFTVTAKVRDNIPAGIDDFTHSTTISDDLSNGVDPTPANNSANDTDTLNAQPDYHIAITDGQTAVVPGQSLSYSISFLNAGNQDGTGVVISDTFPIAILENVVASDGGIVDAVAGTISWNVGNLAAGESRNFTVTAKVRDTIPAGFDDFSHTTTISDDAANGSDPTPADNFSSDTDTLNASPDYQVSINDGVLSATTGQSLTYSVTFANAGLQDGTGVVVSDSFPLAALTNVVASNGGIVDMTSGTITWNVGNLAAGASQTYTVTADVRSTVAAGVNDVTHSTTITDNGANGSDPTPANNSASDTDTLNAAPDLRLTKTDFTNSISPGQGSVYTLNVSNVGTQGASNVVVTETVPTGTTYNAALSDPAWTNVGGNVYQYSIISLPAGAGFNVNFSVLIDNPAVSGQANIVNTATIADDDTNGPDLDPTNDSATDTNTLNAVPMYDIGIDDLHSTVTPGQSLTYYVNFNNYGPQNGTGVVISVNYPTTILTNVVASNGGVVDSVAGTITWNIGALPTNDPRTFEITADVRPTVASGLNNVTLTASIADDGSNGADPDLSDNFSTDTDTLNVQPDYSITINDGKTQVKAGDPLTYTIGVHNNGNQDGNGVTVTVNFPPLVLKNVTASNGGVVNGVAGTITWNLGALPAGASQTLTVNTQVRSNLSTQTPSITLSATVTDDGTNGPDPTPQNNTGRDIDSLQLYAYDSFHDWKEMRFGFLTPQMATVGRPLAPLPVDPIFSGLTEPGSTLIARIYAADGRLLGDRQVVADSGGNWLVSFPNLLIYESPHRMEIIVTPAINNVSHENGFNLRRYFHPAIHTELYMSETPTIAGVFRNRAYNIVEAQHSANTNPLGFQWYAHAYELSTASSNVSQR